MNKQLTFFLLFLSLFCIQISRAQQFGEDIDEFILKIMYGDIKSADLDGDGSQDLIVSGKAGLDGNGTTYIYLNNGNGHFSLHQYYDLPCIMFSSIATGDIDNDGDIDLFLSGTWSGNYTSIYKNDGSGTFTEEDPYELTAVTLGSSIFFDANGDGSLDLFYFGRAFQSVSKLYLNDGTGQFTDTPVNISGFQTGSVVAEDYDKDGDKDLLISGQMNPNLDRTKLFNNDGNGVFTEVPYSFLGVFDGNAAFSDIDSDDDLDIIVNGWKNGVNSFHSEFYLNDGLGNYSNVGNRGLDSLSTCSLALNDVDMDGDEDIFLSGKNSAGADTCALYYNENGFFMKDSSSYSQGLRQGGALFTNMDDNCSPDLVYYGFGDLCLTQTYIFLNKNPTSCPEEEEDDHTTIFQEMEDPTYKVLSNPFRDYIHVEVSEKVLKASIYDLNGNLIYEYLPDSSIIDVQLRDAANGIYRLVFTTANKHKGTSVKLSKIN